MNSLQIRRHTLRLLAAAITLVSAACAGTSASNVRDEAPGEGGPASSQSDPQVGVACSELQCDISATAWKHIQHRHCTGCAVGDKSAFVPGYCGSQANAVLFCTSILAASDCAATTQPNGNIAVTATLAGDVGTLRTDCTTVTETGTVIFKSDKKSVVTQFPGLP
ncbi:hypothetical protein WMF18_39725 [Sorangium sp. So ce315]|uniref:hypothetical protein n=1 Tax=Sorangium sp. So ce315 TaxID=3133299 RepID=UPI003F5F3EFD